MIFLQRATSTMSNERILQRVTIDFTTSIEQRVKSYASPHQEFVTTFLSVINFVAPIRTLRVKSNTKCWFDIDLSNAIRNGFSKTWTLSKTWTRTLKNLNPKRPEPWKTWTQKSLDPEKPGPWKTWFLKNMEWIWN